MGIQIRYGMVGGHMNAEGNRLTAFALRDLLQREGMLK